MPTKRTVLAELTRRELRAGLDFYEAGCSGNVSDGGGVRAAGLRVPHRRVRRGDGVRWPLPLINVSLHVESVGGEEAAAVRMERVDDATPSV